MNIQPEELTEMKGEEINMVTIFKALAEESRLRILSLLMEREMCVCEIEVYLQMTQSNASRHLTVLKNCGLLQCEKNAQWSYFKISDRFKEEHIYLWQYLQQMLVTLPTYQTDHTQCEKYNDIDLCANSQIIH